MPEGEFLVSPATSTGVSWSASLVGIAPPTVTGIPEFSTANAIPIVAKTINSDVFESSTSINVAFTADQVGASGSFYQAVEIEYYRDHSLTAKSKAEVDGAFSDRVFGKLAVWTARILVKVGIDQQATILVSDTDSSALNPNDGVVNFGELIQ